MKIFIYLSNSTELLTKYYYDHINYDIDFVQSKHREILFPELYRNHSSQEWLPRTAKEQFIHINKYLGNLDKLDNLVIATHSETILYTLRCAVKTKKIDPNDLEIRWIDDNGQVTSIVPQAGGILPIWPDAMFSEHYKILEILLGSGEAPIA